MIQSKQDYLNTLKKELKNHPKSEELLLEFEMHISEMIDEMNSSEHDHDVNPFEIIVDRLGEPKQVAALYQQELDATPTKTQWTFIVVNFLFFIAGIFFTTFYHLISLPVIAQLWSALTNITAIIMILYMAFWALLGYEIGKEFGLSGKKLLKKTFYISLIPNLVLMGLVVFRIVPLHWFDPLLTPAFILACIICTIFLYPISYLAFRWGTIRSV